MRRSITWRITIPIVFLTALILIGISFWIPRYLRQEYSQVLSTPSPAQEQREQLESTAQRVQQKISVLALSTVLAMLALTLFISRTIYTPLQELTLFARQVAGETPTLHPRGNEVKQLTLTVHAMARQLRAQIEAVKADRTTMDAVLQHMTDGVLIVDSLGRIRLCNRAAGHIFGIQANAVLGHSLAETLRYYQVVELWQQQRRTQENQITYLELGQPRMFLQSIAVSLEDALPGCTLLIVQNMTQLRRLETIRRDFISNISHELRTPLAALKALTETLQDGALEDPPAARHFLAQMETEVDTLSHMVAELLELSRIESGKVPLAMKEVPPKDLLLSARQRLNLQAERAGLVIVMDVPDGLPDVVADPQRMEQVLVNLLHNAIKFTPSPGTITLSAHEQGSLVTFSVKDTGVGISAEDLPRIFERFYKTDPSRRKEGTGLGLAIARHLVEAHGGQIWAESREGYGSVFSFSLPSVHAIP